MSAMSGTETKQRSRSIVRAARARCQSEASAKTQGMLQDCRLKKYLGVADRMGQRRTSLRRRRECSRVRALTAAARAWPETAAGARCTQPCVQCESGSEGLANSPVEMRVHLLPSIA